MEKKVEKLRHLVQYRDMTDEEFKEVMEKKNTGMKTSAEFEKRIGEKMSEFERDYDLSDLKINDLDTLRALIQAYLTLEDYERYLFAIRSNELTEARVLSLDKLHKVMSDLRTDISKLQGDLSITRKSRKQDQEATLADYIASIKEKAKKFYESKMSYVFCEECGMLLGTFWTLYGQETGNKIVLICNKIKDDGTACGHKTVVGTKELLDNGGTNRREITPESML